MKQKNILKIALFFLLISGVGYGQILTFDFAGNTGSEVTVNSSTNDANLGISTISRGAGLTTSGNADRFNATSWALTSIANAVSGDDYMEFTITPNATFQFSVSSIVVNIQRSGSGSRGIALRSSVDNYAADLDTEYAILDNTSTQTFTFTFAQANSTTAVTYRFYMFAESTGGSGGFEGTGNDIVVNGTVTSATTDPVIGFDAASSTENETDATFTSANIPITVINNPSQIDINISVTGGTAEIGDYTFTSPTALSFTTDETKNITVDINDDADYDDETIIFTITQTSSITDLIISQTTHTLTILDDDIAPNFEDFTNSNATGSYADGNFLGNNGITWTYVASRDENGDTNASGIDGNALMLRRVSDGSKVTSSSIAGGIQNFSVKLYKGFTGSGDRQVEVFINSVSYGKSVIFDDLYENIFTINNINNPLGEII
jgi:trimeric autotransporter adhesin